MSKTSFVYSISDDAVYYIDFAMFLSAEKKGPSVFLLTKDKKVAITFQEHQRLNLGNQYHKNATKVAPRIIEKFWKPQNKISDQNDETLQERNQISKDVEALDRISYLIGKQDISYWGTQETAAISVNLWNPRNFLAIGREVGHCRLLLHQPIHSPFRKGVSYMSPTIQNELIGFVAKHIFQKWLFLQTTWLEYMCMCMYVHVYACISIQRQCLRVTRLVSHVSAVLKWKILTPFLSYQSAVYLHKKEKRQFTSTLNLFHIIYIYI